MFRSMRSKVLAAILSVTAASMLLITLVFYQKSSSMIEADYRENLYGRIRQMGDSFDDSLQEIYHLTALASCDGELMALVEDYCASGNEDKLEELAELLRDYARRNSDMSSVCLLIPEKQVIVTSKDYPIYEKEFDLQQAEQIKKMAQTAMIPAVITDPVRDSAIVLAFASEVFHGTGEPAAYVMGNMDERALYYKYLDRLDDGKLSKAAILDQDNRIVSTKNQNEVGSIYGGDQGERTGRDGILVAYETPFAGYDFFMEVEKSEVLGSLMEIRYFLALILVMACGVAVLPAFFITRAMYQPLLSLTETMELVGDGDLDQRAEVTTRDEIGTLSKDFNNMLEHLQDLIGQLIKEERLKKDAELEALQYQITPHFMYNTLNSIKYAAILRGETEIGSLVEDFVELLQASINKKGTFVTVAEEFHFLENYVNLQRMRYEDKFEVVYHMEAGASGCYLPRLLLQPFVENAILHGLDMKNGNSRIQVSARVEQEMLYLYVKDNGRGMSREQIELLMTKTSKKTSGLSGIGIANVRDRLELYYGQQAGLSYESSGEGTTACICIPACHERDRYAL